MMEQQQQSPSDSAWRIFLPFPNYVIKPASSTKALVVVAPNIIGEPHNNKTTTSASSSFFSSYYYYAHCFAGGVVASGIRWFLTPIEVLKGYQQIGYYPKSNQQQTTALNSLRRIWHNEGLMNGLYKGLTPTAIAYGFQTGTKYSLYELFKSSQLHGMHSYENLIYVTSAACAEFVACLLMCPWEMIRVKMQTTIPNSSQTATSNSFLSTLRTMISNPQQYKFPFGIIGPLWSRQIPGTVVNFYTFENVVKMIYEHVLNDKPKNEYSQSTQLGVTLCAGYVSGIAVGIVSHPADTLISLKVSQPKYKHTSVIEIIRQVGLRRLLRQGLGPRVFMTGTIIGCQWYVYDSYKTYYLKIGTTGGGG